VIAGFLMFSIVLGVIFTWRYIETNVKARRDQLVREYEKTITELERSLKEMRGQTDEAQKQATESHRRADDAQALLQKERDRQENQSQEIETLKTSAGKQRTEVLHLKQRLAETQNMLDDERIAEKTEITKLKQENQLLHDRIERNEAEISKLNQPKPNPPAVGQTKTAGSPSPKPVSLDVAVFKEQTHKFVEGLEKNSFRLFEDKVEQSLSQFSTVAPPWSIGIVLDMSQYVDNLPSLHKAATAFVNTLKQDDEFFVVGNSVTGNRDQPWVYQQFRSVESFDKNTDPLEILGSVKPKGRHVFLDAVSVALDEMRKAKHSHQAILVFSVGWTDRSRHTEREILDAVRKNNVQIYGISVSEPDTSSLGSIQNVMMEITKQSGGHLFDIPFKELTNAATNIGARLHSLYVLEYVPKNQQRNEKYRHITIRLTPSRAFKNVELDYRQGYYAKAQ
jgi:VWFA-related protein